jgi:hypothetical protein
LKPLKVIGDPIVTLGWLHVMRDPGQRANP